MRRLTFLLIILVSTTLQAQKTQLTEVKQVAPSIDSLNWWNYCIRYIGQDFVQVNGISYKIDRKGKIDMNSGIKKLSVATNPVYMWTGNPASFAKTWTLAGGANRFLSRKSLLHIMERHFHPKRYSTGNFLSKGVKFNSAMTVKMLKKYINTVVKKGVCKMGKGDKLEFTYKIANPDNSFMRIYKVILNKTGEVVTCFPVK